MTFSNSICFSHTHTTFQTVIPAPGRRNLGLLIWHILRTQCKAHFRLCLVHIITHTKPILPIVKKNWIKIISSLLKTGSLLYNGKI